MAAIFQEAEIDWKGETYAVTPNYKTIHKIEQSYSIAKISQRILQGEPPVSHIAAVVSVLLTAAGAKDASPEEVFDVIMSEIMEEGRFGEFCELVLICITPQSTGGNAPAPKPGAKRKK